MVKEQGKILQILQLAIRMEQDGKKFYLRASLDTRHQLGKKLLETLAGEEDIHRQQFEKIYETIRQKKAWPKTDFHPNKGQVIRTVFAQAAKETHPSTATEQDAIKVAIDEALACKQSGESKVILFNLSGHGHFDLAAYDEYLSGKLADYEFPEAKMKEALASLPKVPTA